MPGQACVFKAFRASFTLLAVRYIAAADAVYRRHLPLGLGRMPLQPVPPPDDVRLPLRQAVPHQTPQQQLLLPILQIRQHGVIGPHHVQQIQRAPLLIRVDGVGQGHLPLQLPLGAEMHKDLICYPHTTALSAGSHPYFACPDANGV